MIKRRAGRRLGRSTIKPQTQHTIDWADHGLGGLGGHRLGGVAQGQATAGAIQPSHTTIDRPWAGRTMGWAEHRLGRTRRPRGIRGFAASTAASRSCPITRIVVKRQNTDSGQTSVRRQHRRQPLLPGCRPNGGQDSGQTAVNSGQTSVKYWSNCGQNSVQASVKYWSNCGQNSVQISVKILVKLRSE